MDDLTICKKVAEIEGFKLSITSSKKGVWASMLDNNCYDWFNPLTDDALCFRLMVKYDVNVVSPFRLGGVIKWEAQIFSDECEHVTCVCDEYLNKAICLAIIEAHGYD